MNIVRKPVAFNLDDPDQKELYDHAMKRTNFSAYIKRLIQRDMEGGVTHHSISVATASQDFDASEFI
ncbi:hypothetical protein P9848_01385 [Geobacillus stearothermophilus]|uniref:hypothetical protein n=1 Tax=Geobacillus stearothermophilus TaxID=1422 RepID=UPI002E1E8F04|nr:hypothetical protein [Geobacillus stearothermophilus]